MTDAPSDFAPAAKTMNLGAWRQLASPSNIENQSSTNCQRGGEEAEGGAEDEEGGEE